MNSWSEGRLVRLGVAKPGRRATGPGRGRPGLHELYLRAHFEGDRDRRDVLQFMPVGLLRWFFYRHDPIGRHVAHLLHDS
jgi:hypothetical protein